MSANNSAVITPATGKRNRNPLGIMSNKARYLPESQTKDYFLGTRATQVTAEKVVRRHYSAKTASEASWQIATEIDWNSFISDNDHSSSGYPKSATDRRIAIKYLFIAIFGAPPQSHWHDMNLVSVISSMLGIPKNSYTTDWLCLLAAALLPEASSSVHSAVVDVPVARCVSLQVPVAQPAASAGQFCAETMAPTSAAAATTETPSH